MEPPHVPVQHPLLELYSAVPSVDTKAVTKLLECSDSVEWPLRLWDPRTGLRRLRRCHQVRAAPSDQDAAQWSPTAGWPPRFGFWYEKVPRNVSGIGGPISLSRSYMTMRVLK